MKRAMNKFFLSLKDFLKSLDRKGKKPFFLKKRNTLLVFLFVVFLELVLLFNFLGVLPLRDMIACVVPDALVELTNIRRKEIGLHDLTVNPLLEEAARMKAEDMVENDYFAHVSLAGVTPWDWFEKVGYDYRVAGENLAVNFRDPHVIDRAWMESSKHRDNILNEKFEEIGIATARGEYRGGEALYVVQLFGTKRERVPIFEQEREEEIIIAEVFSHEEGVLGQETERRDYFEEEASGTKESFALIEKENGKLTYTIGNPVEILKEEAGELKEYSSILTRGVSRLQNSPESLLLLLAGIFILSILLVTGFFKKTQFSYLLINGTIITSVIFFAIFINHYILLLIKTIY